MGILSFFLGPLGSLALKVIGIAAAAGLVIGIYFYWQAKVVEIEDLKIQKQQLEQIVIQKQKTIKQMQDIADIQEKVSKEQTDTNTTTENKATKIDGVIDNQKDRESSEVLKETFRNLYGVQ
jgi:uncharacterized protein HemX